MLKYFFCLFDFIKKIVAPVTTQNGDLKKSKIKKIRKKKIYLKPNQNLSKENHHGNSEVFYKKNFFYIDVVSDTRRFEFLIRKGIYKYFHLYKKDKLNNLLKIKKGVYYFTKKHELSSSEIRQNLVKENNLTQLTREVVDLYSEWADDPNSSALLNLWYNNTSTNKKLYKAGTLKPKGRSSDKAAKDDFYKKKIRLAKNTERDFYGGSNKSVEFFERVDSGALAPNFVSSSDFFSKNSGGKFRPKKPSFSFIKKYGPSFKNLALKKKKGLSKMWSLEVWRAERGLLARRRRFYLRRKSMRDWRNLNFLRLNYFNKPLLLKTNWDVRKSWEQIYFFRYASRYNFFKNKSTIRVYFLRYLAKRKNSQLKAFLLSLSKKRQKLLFFFTRYEARLDNFILNWGYIRNLSISKSRFLINNGFVYINFHPKFFYKYAVKQNDCVTLTYYGIENHKNYYHYSNIGSTKWHRNLAEYKHISKKRRRRFIQLNYFSHIFRLVRFLKFSHWNKKYFNFFFRFFETSPIIKVFVYFYFYSWFSYKFSKFLNYLVFNRRINNIFLNTRLF